jgi:hypothetical protein
MMHSVDSGSAASVHQRALKWLGVALFGTAIWLAMLSLFPALQATGIATTVSRMAIHATILAGLWAAIARSGFSPHQRITTWLALAVPFTLWLAAIWILAVDGVFISRPGVLPRLPLAIFLPIVLGLVLLLRSRNVTAILAATPASWLIALQCYRALGGTFLVGWAQGDIPGAFALPAGIGDMLVGLTALPVAAYVHAGAPRARQLGLAWNVLGLLDFASAITLGALTSPGPLQLLSSGQPNTLLGAYPAVMIPAFIVPSSILLHALSIRQLRRKATLP